jgi:Peptidase family M1 domain
MKRRRIVGLACCLCAVTALAQPAPNPDCPQTTSALYDRIRSVGLDPQRVYHIRGAAIDRPNLHLDFDDGTLAFTEDICGRITGAFFDGDGEILLRPPNQVERGSLALFTGMAILEEQFSSAYLRFNDDTAKVLQPFLSAAPDPAGFLSEWGDSSRTLAEFDALRLLVDFSHFLPTPHGSPPPVTFPALLHAHLAGKRLGGFEVFYDAASVESLWVGQPREKDAVEFLDVWTSFTPSTHAGAAQAPAADVSITGFRIQATVQPPTRLSAVTDVKLRVRTGGPSEGQSVRQRTLLFELSRYLKVDSVAAGGREIDFIQNPAIEGSQLRRKGNDLVAVVFPAPFSPGQELTLRFTYAGDVLSEAGNGLLYVGERGTWYPNFGLSPAHFEMEFHYPPNWVLVATGKQVSHLARDGDGDGDGETKPVLGDEKAPGEKVSRWVTERPIPVAGFNLGKYVRAEAKAGKILVEAYGTKGVENSFPKPQSEVIIQPPVPGPPRSRPAPAPPIILTPPPPSPANDLQRVADEAASAITSFSLWFGPYPYTSLALTQMPGDLSQGWPSLIFLSSFAFLSPKEQTDLRLDPVTCAIDSHVLVHETAHQWWGDLVLWQSYRDEWLAEGLANYASLLTLEKENPLAFQQIMDKYRHDLLTQNKDGEWLRDAGPVTLGARLDSSHFPNGYEEISYERGTWLFHMLRSMFNDAMLNDSTLKVSTSRDSEAGFRSRKGRPAAEVHSDEPFFRVLRKIRERYAGKTLSTGELIEAFEEELPRPLWYEHRRKLDWFVQSWINGTAIPTLETRDIRITAKAGVTTVAGVIVQKDAPEDLVTAVPVYATTPANTQLFLGEVLADGAETSFRLTAPSGVRKVVLDPKQTILTAPK